MNFMNSLNAKQWCTAASRQLTAAQSAAQPAAQNRSKSQPVLPCNQLCSQRQIAPEFGEAEKPTTTKNT